MWNDVTLCSYFKRYVHAGKCGVDALDDVLLHAKTHVRNVYELSAFRAADVHVLARFSTMTHV